MIKELLSVLFVFNQVSYREPEEDTVRRCWICDELFLSYPNNHHLVCCDCNSSVIRNVRLKCVTEAIKLNV